MKLTIKKTSSNSDFIYFINEEEQEITAVLCNTEHLLQHYIRKYVPICDVTNAKLKPFYKGKAKLHPKDTWNVPKGMAIARKKALNKYHKERARLLSQWLYQRENQMAHLYVTESKWTARLFEDDFGA